MERNLAELALLEVNRVLQFGNGEEAESAREREDAGREVHDGVQLELHERIGEQREPDVAERTDRLEYGTEDAVVHLHVAELREVEDGADGFQDEREGQHRHEDAPRVNVSFLREVGEQDRLVVESGVHAGEQDEHRRYRHDTETAELHQDDQDPVAESGERGADVDDGKSRDAHGGCRREQGLQEVDRFARGYRQVQEHRAQGNEEQVTQHDQRKGISLSFCLEDVLGSRVRESLVL